MELSYLTKQKKPDMQDNARFDSNISNLLQISH